MAITGTKAFTSGEILTANDVNQYLMRGVKVFSSTAVRDAAYGGAGEPTLEEGETCYITATDELQSYDGASWVKIGPAATPGLRIVKNRTTFTTASSITADDVFTSDYDNYLIILTCTATTNTPNMNMQLRVGGVTATGSNYSRVTASFINTATSARTANETAWICGTFDDTTTTVTAITLYSPAAAVSTAYSSTNYFGATAATPEGQLFFGNHSLTTAYDGVIFTPAAGTVTGFYTIYGYNL